MADGYGFGAEGDWKTSLLTRAVKVIGEGLPGGSSFMEDYTYDLGPGPHRVLGAHMLEVCPSIADRRPTLEIHPLGIGNRDDPVRLRFTAATGAAVLVGMCDLGERFRLVANTVDVVAPDEELPKLPVACAVWSPRPSLEVSAECWLTAGGPHHTVLSTAVDADMLDTFATMTSTELTLIDESTTRRGLASELRASDLYYSLAGRR
jgi:L-arabinose isomerase